MPRDAGVYLDDILVAIERIRGYLHGVDRSSLEGDTRMLDAVGATAASRSSTSSCRFRDDRGSRED